MDPALASELEDLLTDVPHARVGRVTRGKRLKVSHGDRPVVDLALGRLRRAFGRNFGRLL